MLREKIKQEIIKALDLIGVKTDAVGIDYPEPQFGDYSTNVALTLAKQLNQKPQDVAKSLIERIDKSMFESVEMAGPGFINFRFKIEQLLTTNYQLPTKSKDSPKILVEYFQPNIAKPLHIGHMRNVIIGDAIKRMLLYLGYRAESETHMGDWGTQFGFLILAYKKYGDVTAIEQDPINELNKLYVQINAEAEKDVLIRELAKQEFVKLEQGDAENRKIWKRFVDWSMEKFLKINQLFDVLPFDHHWPESFYEDKMPAVIEALKTKQLLVESRGAQIVDLGEQKLGVAIIVKSDGATTYLLRDLATFIHRQREGFQRQLYVVDSRQSHTLSQTFAILEKLGAMNPGEAAHLDYGFVSFKGSVLSSRKGNMVLLEDLLQEAEEKVGQIIEDKNPELKEKEKVVKAVAKAALKYFDLKHNRHSDIEFSWDDVLDFEGDSGPYLQYAYARLASILRKANPSPGASRHPLPVGEGKLRSSLLPLGEGGRRPDEGITVTERELLFKLSILPEVVEDAVKDYLPNILANYLYNLATLINKFYHESPVLSEKDEQVKNFRLGLIMRAKDVLGQGLNLLGIEALEEM